MTVDALQARLRGAGLPTTGSKAALEARCAALDDLVRLTARGGVETLTIAELLPWVKRLALPRGIATPTGWSKWNRQALIAMLLRVSQRAASGAELPPRGRPRVQGALVWTNPLTGAVERVGLYPSPAQAERALPRVRWDYDEAFWLLHPMLSEMTPPDVRLGSLQAPEASDAARAFLSAAKRVSTLGSLALAGNLHALRTLDAEIKRALREAL